MRAEGSSLCARREVLCARGAGRLSVRDAVMRATTLRWSRGASASGIRDGVIPACGIRHLWASYDVAAGSGTELFDRLGRWL